MADNDDRTIVTKSKVEDVRGIARPSALEQIEGPGAPRKFVPAGADMVVGREPSVDIPVDSKELSRRHFGRRDHDGGRP